MFGCIEMAEYEAFTTAPSEEALESCTKKQLLELAEHFSVVGMDRRRKDNIKAALKLKLGELGILTSGPAPAFPAVVRVLAQTQGLTFEQQKELLLLQMEHENSSVSWKLKNKLSWR